MSKRSPCTAVYLFQMAAMFFCLAAWAQFASADGNVDANPPVDGVLNDLQPRGSDRAGEKVVDRPSDNPEDWQLATSNANDPGWWRPDPNTNEIHAVLWIPVKTQCAACLEKADDYNQAMSALLNARFRLKGAQIHASALKAKQKKFLEKNRGRNLDPSSPEAVSLINLEDAYQHWLAQDRAEIVATRREIAKQQQRAAQAESALIVCERHCVPQTTSGGVTAGGGLPPRWPQPGSKEPTIPFWHGPYHTECPECRKLVARLNELPDLYHQQMERLKRDPNDKGAISNVEKINKNNIDTYGMLVDCEMAFCPDLYPSDEMPTAKPCDSPLSGNPVPIGPKAKIGGGMAHAVKETAGGLFGSLLGHALSRRGINLGGGGGGSGNPAPPVQDNPVKDMQPFSIPGTGIKLDVGGKFADDGKLLISSKIDDAPGKGTYQSVILHNVDCREMAPRQYYVYDLYSDWTLSVQITKTTSNYVNGALVSQEVETTPWHEIGSGSEKLGSGVIPVEGDRAVAKGTSVWRRYGFDRATAGIDGLGTEFNATRTDLDEPVAVSIHITEPDQDPVMAVPLNLFVCPEKDGQVKFFPVNLALQEAEKFGGGMTEVLPPTVQLSTSVEGEGQVESVADDLQPYRPGGSRAPVKQVDNPIYRLCPAWRPVDDAKLEAIPGAAGSDAGDAFMAAFIHAFGGDAASTVNRGGNPPGNVDSAQ